MMSSETARSTNTVTTPPRDGPTLEQYLETRFALLTTQIEEQKEYVEKRFTLLTDERANLIGAMQERVIASTHKVEERIERTIALREALQKSIDERFAHTDKINSLVQECATRAVDKAEAAQQAHNVASNEWRGTLNDMAGRLVARPEFSRLSDDFAAYKLESARLFSATLGEKTATKEVKDDGRATLAIAISILFGLASFVGTLIVVFARH